MNRSNEIKISSNWTNIGLYGGSLIMLLILPILYLIVEGQEFHMGIPIAILMMLALVGYLIYLFIYVCDARIKDNKLILKKQFRPAKIYTFDKIKEVSAFHVKKSKYVTVEMQNMDRSIEKYVIINSNSILSFESKDSEETLNKLKNSVNRIN